ncbi:hypothetical protein [Telmatospirillum siberiense]|uniref:hypothetical protein n=1 Tax=Telmatospirillum siberiense TaxID=382514 RepID=UPI0011AF9DB1|nr:hypothetical protein [Telmatospirillum siberiense]
MPPLRIEFAAISRILRLMIDVMLRRFDTVEDGMLRMSMSEMRFASGHHVVFLVAMLCGSTMVLRRLLMVVGRHGVMFRATEGGLRNSGRVVRLRQEARNLLHVFLQRIDVVIGIISVGCFRVVDGLPGLAEGDQRLMRRMGVIVPDLIMLRGLPVISRRRLVMTDSGSMMFRGPMFFGHDVTDCLFPYIVEHSLDR